MNALLPILKLILAVLVTAAGGIITISQSGTPIPGWLLAICTSIVAIGAGLGIASSGISGPKVDSKPEAVETLNKVQ